MASYLQGLLVGIAYVAPIGAQNLFVINSALTQPKRRAFLTALIVIFFDVTLALACFFGVGALLNALPFLKSVLLILGGLIVLWIGISLIREKPSMNSGDITAIPLYKVALKACVVTWFNPQAIIDGTMLFGSFRIDNPQAQSTALILGSSSASVIWFLGITVLISLFSAKFNDKVLRVINIICGSIMIIYAAKLIIQFFQTVF